jgi:hypothetical protein
VVSREERRAFLERSLADLEEEHDAGDLGDDDYARLKADYQRRLDVIEGRAEATPRPAAPARPVWQRVGIGVGVLGFAVLAGVLVADAAGRRGAGDTITGADVGGSTEGGDGPTTTQPPLPDDLAACFDVQGSDALNCYIAYTRANPDDARGFLYFGLFSVNQGLQNDSPDLLSGGETFLRRALELDPSLLEARVNLAVLLERLGRDDEAREELAHLDGVDIPADLQPLVDFVESNLADSGG